MAFLSRNLRENEDVVDDDDEDDVDDEDVEVMVDADEERRWVGLFGAEGMEAMARSDVWHAPSVGRGGRALVVGCSISDISKYGSSCQYRSIMEETSSQADMRDGLRRVGWRLDEQTEQSWS
jgi:hypothetical protein